jgi:DNA primase
VAYHEAQGTAWFQRLRARFPGSIRGNEYVVRVCPYCGNTRSNFQISMVEFITHCWSCGVGGTIKGLFYDYDIYAEELPDTPKAQQLLTAKEEAPVVLPPEAQDVFTSEHLASKWACQYLLKRGLTQHEIIQYGIRFAMEGDFARMVIVPLRENGELVYFVARSFMSGAKRTYDYPEVKRRNILPLFRGSENRMKLIMVEGFFEIPKIHRLGYSVVPLLGKTLTNEQVRRLAAMNFEEYVVFLDHDSIDASVRLAETLGREGLKARYANTDGPDSDELAMPALQAILEGSNEPSLQARVKARMRRL